LFYPLKVLLYFAPFAADGLLSERIFHQFFVLAHLLGALFLFLCARELGVTDAFAAAVAAICFSLGGFTGNLSWPYMLDSAIWLPLVFLLLLRAFRTENPAKRLAYACLSGLALGLTLLAGSIHLLFMNVMVVLSAACLFAFRAGPDAASSAPPSRSSQRLLAGTVVLVIGLISLSAAAVQLLPSIEYAPLARRWTGEWSGLFQQRIPYEVAGKLFHLTPRAIFAFLFGAAPHGGAEISSYFGVLPLVLSIVGVREHWSNLWVKYLAGLAVTAFLLSLGDYSLLHGLSYLFIPYFDKLWEAGRFIYLTHFAMALLAGFGAQRLFSGATAPSPFRALLNRLLLWIVIVAAFALGLTALLGTPEVGEWPYVSLFFIIASWAVYAYILRGNRTASARFLVLAVILSDLYVFNWAFPTRLQAQLAGANALAGMKSLRPVASFIQSQPGLFRVGIGSDFSPRGFGDVFGIPTTHGASVTLLHDYWQAISSPNADCLLNIRYHLRAGEDRSEPLVFSSGQWKVYEKPSPCPRAWVVQEAVVESVEEVSRRVNSEQLDLLRVAYLSEPLDTPLRPSPPSPPTVTFGSYKADRLELTADVSATGLLVLSEIYYPGWRATINGQPARIHKVDAILRGLVLAPGSNHVVMEYRPASIRIGAALSLFAFFGTFLFSAFVFRRNRSTASRD
jgi:hypothetical protein